MIQAKEVEFDREKGNFHYETDYEYDAGVGLSEDVVRYVSSVKGEDDWIRDFRLKALGTFGRLLAGGRDEYAEPEARVRQLALSLLQGSPFQAISSWVNPD